VAKITTINRFLSSLLFLASLSFIQRTKNE
jgi:hypothetical protein